MKKLFSLLALAGFASFSLLAQTTEKVTKDETKVHKTSTLPQKVHNTFSKHKRHTGVKVKHTTVVEKKQP